MTEISWQLHPELKESIGTRRIGPLVDTLLHDLHLAKWDGTRGHDPLQIRAKLEPVPARLAQEGAYDLSVEALCESRGKLAALIIPLISSARKSGVKV
jgi:hypothetical protein